MIYCDNAATTKIDDRVLEAMMPYLTNSYGNPSTLYSLGYDAKRAVNKARQTIADYLNCSPQEIFFTASGSEGDNWIVKSSVTSAVFYSPIEHPAVIRAVNEAYKSSQYNHIKVNNKGIIDTQSLLDSFNCCPYHDQYLVSCMAVNNETGCIQPIEELADIAHKNGALFHTDAVQAIGHIPLDVKALNVDFLSFSGHKIYAPKGIGACYIKNAANVMPLISGGGQEFGLRSSTENVAGIVGLGKTIELLSNYTIPDTQLFIDNLQNVYINGENRINSTFSIYIPNVKSSTIQMELALQNIFVGTGSACHSGNDTPSYVLKAMGCDNDRARQSIRVSFGKNNTNEDCIAVAKAITKLTKLGA